MLYVWTVENPREGCTLRDFTVDDVKSVCEKYGIDVEVLREYEFYPRKASIVGGALRIMTERQVVYMKRVVVPTPIHVQAIFEAVEGLAARGARVLRFLRTKYGDPYVIHETGYYYALSQVTGRIPDFESPEEFIEAFATLAEWHASAKVNHGILYQPRRIDVTYEWSVARAKLEIYREYALDREEPTELDERFLAIREDIDQQIGVSLAKLLLIPYEQITQEAVSSGTLCHGSFVRKNLVKSKDGLFVLDHDHLYEGSQMLDLAHFLQRYGAQQSFDIDLCQRALAKYEAIRPITQKEWSLLEVLLSFPSAIIQVLQWYYEQRRDWDIEDFIDVFEDACDMDVARLALRRHLFGSIVEDEPSPIPLHDFFKKYGKQNIEFEASGVRDEEDLINNHIFTTKSVVKKHLTANAESATRISSESAGLWRPTMNQPPSLGSTEKESD